jgi:hypothetical protein
MPKAYEESTGKLASKLNIQYATNVSPAAITYASVNELPLEVAKARWPEDFVEPEKEECPQCKLLTSTQCCTACGKGF